MRDINKVILIGRLGKDPEVVNFESGTKKVSFSLATGESYTNRNGEKVENTEWHNVVMWRKLAEIAEQYLSKGDPVYVEGKLRTRSYDDKDGNRRYITEVEVENLSMLGSRSDRSNESNANATPPPPARPNKQSNNTPTDDVSFEDDLPF